MATKITSVEPGDKLYGFCGGAFGHDDYDEKTVVAIGRDWVVVRDEDGRPLFAAVAPAELAQYTESEDGFSE